MSNKGFMTARGYEMVSNHLQNLTPCMEDYMEMIYRLGRGNCVRTGTLAKALSVNRSSVTKMVKKLAARGLVEYEPYGEIVPTSEGFILGKYLFERHEILRKFLDLIGIKDDILQVVEGIEHNLSQDALNCIREFTAFTRQRPDWWKEFQTFKENPPSIG